MSSEAYPNSNGVATISGAGPSIPAGPPHVVRYALNSGPGLNIPAWAVYIALAHSSDDHGLSERTHREIADAIDAGSVSTVKVALQHLEYFGKVEVTRRPGATGGRNLPNIYRIIGEEFNWEPTPKEPREPGQIFAAYRRRHAEIETEYRRRRAGPAPAHRRTRGRRKWSCPPPRGSTPPSPSNEAAGSREDGHPDRRCAPQPPPDTPSPPRDLQQRAVQAQRRQSPRRHCRTAARESQGQELDSRETAIAPDLDPPLDPPEEAEDEENEVDLLTREFWPWIKGKWDDINNAIHWYKRNRGEWTRQLKNARAARAAEEREQTNPEDQADRHRPGYEPGGEETERIPVWDSSIQADPDARSLWRAVLADLQLQLPRPTFDTWLKPTAGVAFQGDRFIVVAPTPFAVEWLERRMFHALQSTLERAAGRGLQLRLQTLEAHNGDDAPVGDDDQGNPAGPDHEPPDHEPGGETGE